MGRVLKMGKCLVLVLCFFSDYVLEFGLFQCGFFLLKSSLDIFVTSLGIFVTSLDKTRSDRGVIEQECLGLITMTVLFKGVPLNK
jgi:hypothetical protein